MPMTIKNLEDFIVQIKSEHPEVTGDTAVFFLLGDSTENRRLVVEQIAVGVRDSEEEEHDLIIELAPVGAIVIPAEMKELIEGLMQLKPEGETH